MNKIKVALIAIAILTAVGGAFATKPCVQCEINTQYYWNGQAYVLAGDDGIDYYCYDTGGVCTYYKPNPLGQPNYYAPCVTGVHMPLP
jgi:hypothetical protein